MRDISNVTISPSTTLLAALKTMDERKVKTLFVFDGNHFEGLFTLGDVQRAIIKNYGLDKEFYDRYDPDELLKSLEADVRSIVRYIETSLK